MLDFQKPLFQATIGDLKEALTMVLRDIELESEGRTKTAPKRYVYGIAGIAKLFNCSESTAQKIKSSGEIDDAISQIGDIIIVDGDYALDLLRVSKKYRTKNLNRSKK